MLATYYYPWGFFYPARSGADTVACRHLDYFRQRGIRPHIVLTTGFWTDPASEKRAAFESHYSWAEDIVVLNVTRRPEIHARLSRWSFADHLAGHALLAECPEVKKVLGQPADLALINYVFATPLVEALPASTFRVLESHDIMSAQYVRQTEAPARFQHLLATEFALYDAYDLVMMLNEQEADFARSHCLCRERGAPWAPWRSATARPPWGGLPRPSEPGDGLGRPPHEWINYVPRAVDLAEEISPPPSPTRPLSPSLPLSLSPSPHRSFSPSPASPSPASPSDQPYDLLFVASAQAANIEGANWFYTKLFEPLLKPAGLRWAIAGSVCGHLSLSDPQVVLLGIVDDLTEVYRRSKVVVVPLFQGTGISIKTLEALGQRKPVVTTPCGRRGLPAEADGALVCCSFQDDPRHAAEAVLRLCSSELLRSEYGRRAAAFIQEHFSVQSYRRRMDQLLEPLVGPRSVEKLPPAAWHDQQIQHAVSRPDAHAA